jgi:hypothetical protein
MTFTEMKYEYPRHPDKVWWAMNRRRSEDVHYFVMRNTGRDIHEQIWEEIYVQIRIRYQR